MNGPVASLNTAWFALIGLLWTGYLVLEGFDFGVGVLSLAIGRDDLDRQLARNAIGPVWDGNEVWLIVAAGATFAAFPVWYASMFSGFYLVLFGVLVALIVRGVSFEFRGQRASGRWRYGWDVALAIGSLVPAFAWGVVFTDLVHGLPLSPSGFYLGDLPRLLAPELEAHPPDDQRDQHDEQREVEAAEQAGVPDGEGGEGRAGRHDQPDLVAVPDRADGVAGQPPVQVVRPDGQAEHTDAEIEPVEHEVTGPQQANQGEPRGVQAGYWSVHGQYTSSVAVGSSGCPGGRGSPTSPRPPRRRGT